MSSSEMNEANETTFGSQALAAHVIAPFMPGAQAWGTPQTTTTQVTRNRDCGDVCVRVGKQKDD